MSEASKPHSGLDRPLFDSTFVRDALDGDTGLPPQEGWWHILHRDEVAVLIEQLEAAQSVLREIGSTYDGVTPIFRKTGTKLLGADAFTYAPDICEALNQARRWPVTYPASTPKEDA